MTEGADEPLTWFVDRSMGRSVAVALVAAGEKCVHHDDVFPQDAVDELWLPAVATYGWLVITKDKAIRRRFNEREAHMTAGGRAFFLTSGQLTGAEMRALVVASLPQMKALVAATRTPFLALVTRTEVQLYVPPSGRR